MITLSEQFGWQNCLVLSNEHAEVIITTEVGPRILGYRLIDGSNVFKTYEDQLGKQGEPDWQIRGGHRLWVAPEREATYFADNHPVNFEITSDFSVALTAPEEPDSGYRKTIEISLSEKSAGVDLRHTLTALKPQTSPIALWSLSVMKPGGTASVPLPEFIAHPSDTEHNVIDEAALLPNQQMILWPYTRLNDPRFNWHDDRLEIKQQTGATSAKVGFLHQANKVEYEVAGTRFCKSIESIPDSNYPDRGCNLEIYTNDEMLELEGLGPLRMLEAGESINLSEQWTLLPAGD